MPLPRRSAMRWKSAACLVVPGNRCTASTAAQRTSLEPCLVMGPRRTVVSDSRWRGASETMNVADLGHEDRRQHRAHPRDGLDRQVADVAGQGRADLAPKHRDLLVKDA